MSKYTMPDDNQPQNNGQASFHCISVGGGGGDAVEHHGSNKELESVSLCLCQY